MKNNYIVDYRLNKGTFSDYIRIFKIDTTDKIYHYINIGNSNNVSTIYTRKITRIDYGIRIVKNEI